MRPLGQRAMPEVITKARGSEAWSSLGRARYVRCGSRSEAKDPRGGGEVRPCVTITLRKAEVMTVNSEEATNVH